MNALNRFLFCIVAAGCASNRPGPPPNPRISSSAWREDLEVVRKELPRRHANAFHLISRATFEAAVDDLASKADQQDSDVRFVGLARVLNRVGDGHTGLLAPVDRAYFPVQIREFDGDLRIARVAPGLEAALGARVLKVGDTPAQQALRRALELTPEDENAPLRHALAANYLSRGLMLHGLDLIPERTRVTYTLADDTGRVYPLEVKSIPSPDWEHWSRPYPQPPLSERHVGEPFWCVNLAEERTVYCNFRAYDGLGSRAAEMVKMVQTAAPEKLVIDLRDNGGGDYTEGERHVIRPIQRMVSINRQGHLFVLVGPSTFSAAMNNAVQFRSMTAAILVGDTIGEKPNSYQEPRELTLPNSHLTVRYSTEWYAFLKNGPNVVEPDIRIVPSWAQYAAGKDPVLEYVLAARAAGLPVSEARRY